MKRKVAIVASIATLFVLIGMAVLLSFKGQDSKKTENMFEANMQSIISGNYNEDFKYISMNGTVVDRLSDGDISSAIMQNISYKLVKSEIEDEYAIVTAKFTYPDVVAIYDNLLAEDSEISDEELRTELINIFESGDFPITSCTAEIPMIYYDEVWYFVESEQFNDILTGGVYSKYIRQNEEIYDAFKKAEEGEDNENQ